MRKTTRALSVAAFADAYARHTAFRESGGAEGELLSLQGADMAGWDLSGLDLSGANLRYAHAEGADLSGARLMRACLCGMRAAGAVFEDCLMRKASASDMAAPGARFALADADGADFRRLSAPDSDWSGACLSRCDFELADLSSARMANIMAPAVRLRRCDLSGATATNAKLLAADMVYARCHGTDFHGSALGCADLGGADVPGADMSGCDLRYAVLGMRDCEYLTLAGADARGAWPITPYLDLADTAGALMDEGARDGHGFDLESLGDSRRGDPCGDFGRPWERGGWGGDPWPPDTPKGRLDAVLDALAAECERAQEEPMIGLAWGYLASSCGLTRAEADDLEQYLAELPCYDYAIFWPGEYEGAIDGLTLDAAAFPAERAAHIAYEEALAQGPEASPEKGAFGLRAPAASVADDIGRAAHRAAEDAGGTPPAQGRGARI